MSSRGNVSIFIYLKIFTSSFKISTAAGDQSLLGKMKLSRKLQVLKGILVTTNQPMYLKQY